VDEVRGAGIIPGGLALTDAADIVTVLVRHFLGVRSARGGHHTSALVAARAPFYATIRSLTLGAGPERGRSRRALADLGSRSR
jgi:hypothetical protein